MNIKGVSAYSLSTTKVDKSNSAETVATENLFETGNTASQFSTQTKSEEYLIEMSTMIDLGSRMRDNVNIVTKLNAHELAGIIISATSKAYSIISSVKSTVSGYASQISMLLNNPFLSESELNAQINLLKDKINAAIDEGESKIMTLYSVSEILMALAPSFGAMNKKDFGTNDIMSILKQLIEGTNTKPSDFSNAEDKSDLYDIIDNNESLLFGQNCASRINETKTKVNDKIKDIEEKLKNKNLTKDEEKQLRLELLVCKAEKRIFDILSAS